MKFAQLLGLVAGLRPLCHALYAGRQEQSDQSTGSTIPSLLNGLRRCNVSGAPRVYDFVLAGIGDASEPLWNRYTHSNKSEVVERKKLNQSWNRYTEPSTAAQRTQLKAAIREYHAQEEALEAAERRLQNAMEALLEVPSVDGPTLSKLLLAKRNTLVVFYAPWCGQCQRFVLSDGSGNPSMAPLEVFRRKLAWNDATKHIGVVRFDVQRHSDEVPSAFPLVLSVGIPAFYFIDSTGHISPYLEDPHESGGLQRFVLAHAK